MSKKFFKNQGFRLSAWDFEGLGKSWKISTKQDLPGLLSTPLEGVFHPDQVLKPPPWQVPTPIRSFATAAAMCETCRTWSPQWSQGRFVAVLALHYSRLVAGPVIEEPKIKQVFVKVLGCSFVVTCRGLSLIDLIRDQCFVDVCLWMIDPTLASEVL